MKLNCDKIYTDRWWYVLMLFLPLSYSLFLVYLSQNSLFLGNGLFLVGNLALSIFGLFLFCFCLVWGEQVTDARDFGWQPKGEDHFRSRFPFFFLFTRWQLSIVQMLSGPKTFLYISSVFFRCLIENFLSFSCLFPFGMTLWFFEFYSGLRILFLSNLCLRVTCLVLFRN